MTKKRIGKFMKPWQGALAPLYSAISDNATEIWYEPEDNGNRGYPALATLQENASDKSAAKKTLEYSPICNRSSLS